MVTASGCWDRKKKKMIAQLCTTDRFVREIRMHFKIQNKTPHYLHKIKYDQPGGKTGKLAMWKAQKEASRDAQPPRMSLRQMDTMPASRDN